MFNEAIYINDNWVDIYSARRDELNETKKNFYCFVQMMNFLQISKGLILLLPN